MILNNWLPIILGYFYAIIGGHIFISWIVNKLWDEVQWRNKPDLRPVAYVPKLVGMIERMLYVAAFQFNSPEFVAVWLALKVAGQWNRWEDDVHLEDGRIISGRFFFGIFLIGSALSIFYGFSGYQIIENLASQKIYEAIILAMIVILISVLFWIYIWWHQRKSDVMPQTLE